MLGCCNLAGDLSIVMIIYRMSAVKRWRKLKLNTHTCGLMHLLQIGQVRLMHGKTAPHVVPELQFQTSSELSSGQGPGSGLSSEATAWRRTNRDTRGLVVSV